MLPTHTIEPVQKKHQLRMHRTALATSAPTGADIPDQWLVRPRQVACSVPRCTPLPTARFTQNRRMYANAFVGVLAILFHVPSLQADYRFRKELLVNNIPATVPIFAGGTAETWSDLGPKTDTYVILRKSNALGNKSVTHRIDHAKTLTDSAHINGGILIRPGNGPLPRGISPVLGNLGQPVTVASGYDPLGDRDTGLPGDPDYDPKKGFACAEDAHVAKNTACIRIKVDARNTTVPRQERIKISGVLSTFFFNNYVSAKVRGWGKAGKPTDGHGLHSANSIGAVDLPGVTQDTYTYIGPADPTKPTIKVAKKINEVVAGQGETARIKKNSLGKIIDPVFVSLMDVTDLGPPAVVEIKEVMTTTIEWNEGVFERDDTGIRLTVDRSSPESFVSLVFATAASDWVEAPYSYAISLGTDGVNPVFSVSGEQLPESGWSLTITGDTIEAFFPFGSDEDFSEFVSLSAPDALHTIGREYTLDVGESVAGFELAVPEPSTLSLLAMGWPMLFRRRR